MLIKMRATETTQSILEYIVTLTVIVTGVVIGTIGLRTGMRRGLQSVNDKIGNDILAQRTPPAAIMEEDFFQPTSQDFFADAERNEYGGPALENTYYFHEGDSDMDHVPEEGSEYYYDVPVAP